MQDQVGTNKRMVNANCLVFHKNTRLKEEKKMIKEMLT